MTDHCILWEMGYRPIASEAHAEQLLRRQLKRMRGDQQRHTPHSHSGCTAMSAEFLLRIRPGTLYRLLRRPGGWSDLLLITPGKPADAEIPNAAGK